jgi:ribosomal protein S12 methylthiotransferase
MNHKKQKTISVALVSLGCAKNLVDSEKMLGALGEAGFVVSGEPDGADVVIVNTCSFIQAAREESARVIEEMLRLKRKGRVKRVVVAGCLPQRFRERLLHEIPEIDAIAGAFRQEELPQLLRRVVEKQAAAISAAQTYSAPQSVSADTARLRLTPRHYAYLRITEGCDNRCAYCAIPDIRGPLRSKPFEAALSEAKELAADGARELILIGQDTTAYGTDLYGKSRLPELVRELAGIEGARWLRVLYTHPAHYSEEFIGLFGEVAKLLPYVDMPIQHASDRILAAMGRRVTKAQIESLISKLRGEIPGVALRTSIITGFPGETEEDFAELVEFLKAMRFDRLGAFTYSREEGTPAAEMPSQVPPEAARERLDALMRMQQEISRQANAAFIGKELEVVAEGVTEDGEIVARSYREAPDVDGVIIVESKDPRKKLRHEAGEFFRVKIVRAGPYDCMAEPV